MGETAEEQQKLEKRRRHQREVFDQFPDERGNRTLDEFIKKKKKD